MLADESNYRLPDDWNWLDADRRRQFDEELQRELHPTHLLYRAPVVAIANHNLQDDVLFRHRDQPDRFTVIHLTWSGKPERPYFPGVECDGSYSDFLHEFGTGDE